LKSCFYHIISSIKHDFDRGWNAIPIPQKHQNYEQAQQRTVRAKFALTVFLSALISIIVILVIWQLSRKSSISTLLLVGLGINLFLSAVISVFIASAPNEQELRSIVFGLQGGLEARTWHHSIN
jgi:ABC-type Fe3+-siderophore transport system permease subunit